MTGREKSNLFWEPFTLTADGIENFGSLDEMVQGTDVVVVGRFAHIEVGRVVEGPEVDFPFMSVTVAIDRVLAGTLETQTSGQLELELFLPDQRDLEQVQANLPDHRHLLFLRNAGESARRHERPVEEQEARRFIYTRPSFQAVLRDIDGMVMPIPVPPRDQGGFPSGLEGESFDELVEREAQVGGG